MSTKHRTTYENSRSLLPVHLLQFYEDGLPTLPLLWQESSGMPNGTKPPRESVACECRQRAMLVDRVSRVLFPASFILLNCVYWSLYLDS